MVTNGCRPATAKKGEFWNLRSIKLTLARDREMKERLGRRPRKSGRQNVPNMDLRIELRPDSGILHL